VRCSLVGKNDLEIEALASSKSCLLSAIRERIAFLGGVEQLPNQDMAQPSQMAVSPGPSASGFPSQSVQEAQPPPKQERTFDQSKIAALLDKRDPTRQAMTGDALNSNAALGLAKGKASDNSATWGALFQSQVERCWKKPYGGIESQNPEAAFAIKLKRDGTLEGMPVPEGTPATPYLRVYQESALRAIIECQPYNLPAAYFEEWKYFAPVFTERKT